LSTAAYTAITVSWTTGDCEVGIPAGVNISPYAGSFRLSQSSSFVSEGPRFLSREEKGGRDVTLIPSLLTKPKFRKCVILIARGSDHTTKNKHLGAFAKFRKAIVSSRNEIIVASGRPHL
jgi:hypothetical protein